MAKQTWARALFAASAAFLAASAALAQDAVEAFYRGKTVTILIGSPPGGGYDAYARLIGRHLSQYIPGHPTVIESNMSGAGGNTVANYVYSIAPRDGTFIAASSPGSLLDPLLSEKANLKYDPLTFNYLGSANGEDFTCIVRKDAGVDSFKDAFSKEIYIGVSSGTTHDMPRALVNVLGVKFKLIAGYPGTQDIMLAMDKGEVQGICGQGIANISWQRPDWFRDPAPVRILVQESSTGDPDLNKRGVPLAVDFAKTPEQREILDIVYAQGVFTRPYFIGPEVPKERVDALRSAFTHVLADPELRAEAETQKLRISVLSGDELAGMIAKIYATAPDVIAKVRKAILDP